MNLGTVCMRNQILNVKGPDPILNHDIDTDPVLALDRDPDPKILFCC